MVKCNQMMVGLHDMASCIFKADSVKRVAVIYFIHFIFFL